MQAADLTKPVDKRLYKGTFPTCHDFNNLLVSSDSVRLLVGFTAGQVQLIDPIKKELGKLFNEEVFKIIICFYHYLRLLVTATSAALLLGHLLISVFHRLGLNLALDRSWCGKHFLRKFVRLLARGKFLKVLVFPPVYQV